MRLRTATLLTRSPELLVTRVVIGPARNLCWCMATFAISGRYIEIFQSAFGRWSQVTCEEHRYIIVKMNSGFLPRRTLPFYTIV